MSDRGYISIPAIGNINVATQSNVGLTAFLYPLPDGGLTTFMNPIVSAETFLGRIKNRNAVQVDADVSLLSSAFYAWSGFNTIDIAVRSSSDIDLPGSLFRFMKLGMDAPEGSSYQMRDLMLQTDNYVEIGLGHGPSGKRPPDIGRKAESTARGRQRADAHRPDECGHEPEQMGG